MDVFVLTIDHDYGVNLSVHWTQESAEQEVYEFVVEWWKDSVNDEETPLPDDRYEAIASYFDNNSDDETYSIEKVSVTGSPAPKWYVFETDSAACIGGPFDEQDEAYAALEQLTDHVDAVVKAVF